MTPEQEQHLERVKARFALAADHKYRAGQKEHGGNLWLKPGMVDMLLEEAIDFYIYLATLKEQIETNDLNNVIKPQNKEMDMAVRTPLGSAVMHVENTED